MNALRCACTRVFAADTFACESRTIPSIDPVTSYALLLARSVLRVNSSVPASSIASVLARPSVNCESCACSLDAALAMRPGEGVAAAPVDPAGEPPADDPGSGLPPSSVGAGTRGRNAVTPGGLTIVLVASAETLLDAGTESAAATCRAAFALPFPAMVALLHSDL